MLDIKFIRENVEVVKDSMKRRNMTNVRDVDVIAELDAKYIAILREVEQMRALRNELNKKVAAVSGDEKTKVVADATALKETLTAKERDLEKITKDLEEVMYKMPNLLHADVPVGPDESSNKVIRSWGTPGKFTFTPKDHVQLGKLHDLIDTDKSGEISGSRFCYLKNELVLLQFAIIQFVFKTLTDSKIIANLAKKVGNPSDKPFMPILPPVMMKPSVMKKMARLGADSIEERYYIPSDDLVLVGSAEHTLGPLHMDETLHAKDLPIRYIGYSTAFRREAGSYGKDIRGILRQHQFDKLEMETFCLPEQGLVEQDLLVAIQEYLLQQLDLPYQVIAICTGDMGKPDYRQIDLEAWLPGQNKYREVQTSDYMTDYQSRRLNTRYIAKDDRGYVHMNDATALALGRTMIAILENYQEEDGSVKIPKVLQSYMGGINIIKVK